MCGKYRRVLLTLLASVLCVISVGQCEEFLGDASTHIDWTHQQQWGDFGLQTAAAPPGATGSPLRIGEKTFDRGLGHHANGEIVIDLKGQFVEFRSLIGVQWQGGNKGSVVFRIAVDGEVAFESSPMSDSDPAQEVNVPLQHSRELRLIASDAGDGIGCDMANWVEARLVRDPQSPGFGTITTTLAGQPAPPPSTNTSGFSLVASEDGPQVAVMQLANTCTVSVRRDETVHFGIPVEIVGAPLRILVEAAIVYGQRAEVSLAIDEKQVTRTVEVGDGVTLELEGSSVEQLATIALATRGMNDEAGVRWRRLRCVSKESSFDVPLNFPQSEQQLPPRILPPLRPAIEQELVEWDWRMQDGIGTEREPRTWELAIENVMQRGDNLLRDLAAAGSPLG